MSDVKPISLADLMPADVVLEIKQPRLNRVLQVPIKTLSWEEWDSIGREVKEPEIPYTALAEDEKTKLPNPQDKRYLEQLETARRDRLARRIFACLERGGNDFPGATALEKYENLKQADWGMAEALIRGVLEANQIGRSELQTLAASFRNQPVSPDDDAYSDEDAMDTITMVKPA